MNVHRSRFVLIAAAGVALTTACGGSRQAAAPPSAPVSVTVETVAAKPFAEQYEAVGTVASTTTSVLSSQVTGRVTAVRVREGDAVRAGQVLVELDARDASARSAGAEAGVTEAGQALVEADRAIEAAKQGVTAAEASLRLATVTYERYRQLLAARSVSPQEFDEVESRWRVATAEVERARTNVTVLEARRLQVQSRIEQARAGARATAVTLDDTRIVAPFAGRVTRKTVDVGTMATPGTPLLVVENDGAYQLEASVEESFALRVMVGMAVPVRIDAVGLGDLGGTVAEVAPSADPASRSVIVKIALAPVPGVRAGMYGSAIFPAGERTAISVPAHAVVERGQMRALFVVDAENVARLRFVGLGKRAGDRIEVLSGLAEGERVVVANPSELTDGRPVVAQSVN